MGKRGEGWVIAQIILFILIALAPLARPLRVSMPLAVRVLGLALIGAGGAMGLAALFKLGRNVSPFPVPVQGGYLVTSGAYGLVRHPIYTSLIAAAFGWAAVTGSVLALVLAIALFLLFDGKSRFEERRLKQTYPDYPAYRARVKKLIPWLY